MSEQELQQRIDRAIPVLQTIMGMCSDAAPHEQIDVRVDEVLGILYGDREGVA